MASDPLPQTSSATTTPAAPPSTPAATSAATRPLTNPPPTRPTPSIPQPPQHHQLHTAQHQPLANLSLRPPNPSTPQLLKTHDAPQTLIYPLASSGRGFIPKPIRPQPSDQAVTVANPGGFPPRSIVSFPLGSRPHLDPIGHPVHMMRPPLVHYPHPAGTVSAPIKGYPVSTHPKVASSPLSVPDSNGYKNMRDRSRDDTFAVVKERKVRISDGSSLYAMCRSWLKNGFQEETQPQYMEGVKSLPRPLPIPVADVTLPKRKEWEEEEEEEENDESVEQLSAQDLLKKHVKRAKRVRSRLREERLQRIARYKTRLGLLLPPPVEQFRNDATAGN